MQISANSPLAFRPATPGADVPARANNQPLDRYEGPSRPADDQKNDAPKPNDPPRNDGPRDGSRSEGCKQPNVDTEAALDDAKVHLQQAAAEVGRLLLAPIDAAIKTVDFARYYASLLKRAVVDTGTAVRELVQVSEKEAQERK